MVFVNKKYNTSMSCRDIQWLKFYGPHSIDLCPSRERDKRGHRAFVT